MVNIWSLGAFLWWNKFRNSTINFSTVFLLISWVSILYADREECRETEVEEVLKEAPGDGGPQDIIPHLLTVPQLFSTSHKNDGMRQRGSWWKSKGGDGPECMRVACDEARVPLSRFFTCRIRHCVGPGPRSFIFPPATRTVARLRDFSRRHRRHNLSPDPRALRSLLFLAAFPSPEVRSRCP